MRTYIYKVGDIFNINPIIYYYKRKYLATAFVNKQHIERQEEMDRLSMRMDLVILNSDYACYEILETIRTED